MLHSTHHLQKDFLIHWNRLTLLEINRAHCLKTRHSWAEQLSRYVPPHVDLIIIVAHVAKERIA